ncbi:GRP family sugar transporter [Angustibacter aerolatus]
MGALLGLLSALAYGSSDFVAGLAGRRGDPRAVAAVAQPFALVAALLAVVVARPDAPTAPTLWWGLLSGVGSAVGTLALYRGLAVARMSVVAPVSALVSAAGPALVGLLTGDRLSTLAWVGIVVALPGVVLVSRAPADDDPDRSSGVGLGLLAGAAFALLFVALARAGTDAGAWPLVPGQVLVVVVVWVYALVPRRVRPDAAHWRSSVRPAVGAGVLGGAANLLYLAATGAGQLAVVAVLTSLYPAITVLLARTLLGERWGAAQKAGLGVCAAAVAAIALG